MNKDFGKLKQEYDNSIKEIREFMNDCYLFNTDNNHSKTKIEIEVKIKKQKPFKNFLFKG